MTGVLWIPCEVLGCSGSLLETRYRIECLDGLLVAVKGIDAEVATMQLSMMGRVEIMSGAAEMVILKVPMRRERS